MIGTRNRELTDWFQTSGAQFLRSLGIGPGWQVLDFGAGMGSYAVPLARVVGPEGAVYAVDKRSDRLQEMETRLPAPLRKAVHRMPTDGDVHLRGLADGELDGALLFDVLQHVDVEEWPVLFDNVARCLSTGGMLYVNASELSHPGRVDMNRLHRELARVGFSVQRTLEARVMHNDHMSYERIYVCRLEDDVRRPRAATA